MFLYVFLGECLAAKGGGECAAADSVASTGDNGSCDCAQYCASNWAGNVKRQRPNWKGATSVSGAAAGPTCTCVEATHWCDKPGNTKGCSNSCNWSGKPKPRALCNAEVWEIACTSGTPSAGWSGIGEEERYSVAACKGEFTSTDAISSSNPAAMCNKDAGFRVCTGTDMVKSGLTYTQGNSFSGCFVYNAANDCHGCFDTCASRGSSVNGRLGCRDDMPEGHDIAGLGSDCADGSGGGMDGRACVAGGRINGNELGNEGCQMGRLSSGAAAGVAIAVLVAVIGCSVAFALCYRKQNAAGTNGNDRDELQHVELRRNTLAMEANPMATAFQGKRAETKRALARGGSSAATNHNPGFAGAPLAGIHRQFYENAFPKHSLGALGLDEGAHLYENHAPVHHSHPTASKVAAHGCSIPREYARTDYQVQDPLNDVDAGLGQDYAELSDAVHLEESVGQTYAVLNSSKTLYASSA
eukprot:gene12873-11759_t